jgi:hypothetical protein
MLIYSHKNDIKNLFLHLQHDEILQCGFDENQPRQQNSSYLRTAKFLGHEHYDFGHERGKSGVLNLCPVSPVIFMSCLLLGRVLEGRKLAKCI